MLDQRKWIRGFPSLEQRRFWLCYGGKQDVPNPIIFINPSSDSVAYWSSTSWFFVVDIPVFPSQEFKAGDLLENIEDGKRVMVVGKSMSGSTVIDYGNDLGFADFVDFRKWRKISSNES